MKSKLLPRWRLSLSAFLSLFLTAVIIYSCRKDIRLSHQTTDLSTDQLSELQNIYAKGLISGSGITTAATGSATFPNFVHSLAVKWDKYVINNRTDGSKVVEFDMQPDTGLVTTKAGKQGDTVFFKNHTSAVFIQLANGQRINCFMKVIEDFSRTKQSVIKQMRYRQVPATFTGLIIFYTLDRKFINGNRYYNGKLAASLGLPKPQSVKQTQSLKTDVLQDPGSGSSCGGVTVTYYYSCNGAVGSDGYYYYDCTAYPESAIPDDECGGGPGDGVTGDTGNSGGGGNGTTPQQQQQVDTTKAPCTEVNNVNARAVDSVIALENQRIMAALNNSSITNEYGVSQNVGTVGSFNYQYLTPNSNQNGGTTYQSVFYWQPGAYTIGWSHDHMHGSGLDAADILVLGDYVLNSQYNSALTAAGASSIAFYKANVSMTELLPTGAYTVTVHDWNAYAAVYHQYSNNPDALDQQRDDYAVTYLNGHNQATNDEAQAYAMMKIFGSGINIYRKLSNETSYSPLYTDSNGTVQENPCQINKSNE